MKGPSHNVRYCSQTGVTTRSGSQRPDERLRPPRGFLPSEGSDSPGCDHLTQELATLVTDMMLQRFFTIMLM